jgi:hypothetical protein
MLDAEIATFPATEFEPGRLTPPPASIAKLGAVRLAPFRELTEPGVEILKCSTFDELMVRFAPIKI